MAALRRGAVSYERGKRIDERPPFGFNVLLRRRLGKGRHSLFRIRYLFEGEVDLISFPPWDYAPLATSRVHVSVRVLSLPKYD